MTKVFLGIALMMSIMLGGLVLFPPAATDYTQNPLSERQLQLSEPLIIDGFLDASSFQWEQETQRWLIGSLDPQTVMKNGAAQLAYLNQDQLTDIREINTSGAIADFSRIDQRMVSISEKAKLSFYHHDGQQWQFSERRTLLKGGVRHKTAALTWDQQQQRLYTCESEGVKLCYQANREAEVEREFHLSLGDAEQDKLLLGFSISSLDFFQGQLYALSEVYSSLLRIDPETGQVLDIWRLPQTGIARSIANDGQNLHLLSTERNLPQQFKLYQISFANQGVS